MSKNDEEPMMVAPELAASILRGIRELEKGKTFSTRLTVKERGPYLVHFEFSPEKLLLTTDEVAEQFGVTKQTVLKWMKTWPWFQPSGRSGRGFLWSRETIERRRNHKPINIYD